LFVEHSDLSEPSGALGQQNCFWSTAWRRNYCPIRAFSAAAGLDRTTANSRAAEGADLPRVSCMVAERRQLCPSRSWCELRTSHFAQLGPSTSLRARGRFSLPSAV